MSPSISIRPSKDIRTNYAQISALTRQNPVAITVNGKEDTVLLSHEDFQDQLHYISELEAKLSVYSHLAQAMDDIKLGRVQRADDAFADILGELESLDLCIVKLYLRIRPNRISGTSLSILRICQRIRIWPSDLSESSRKKQRFWSSSRSPVQSPEIGC